MTPPSTHSLYIYLYMFIGMLFCSAACGDGRIERQGELGQLQFSYPTADRVEDKNRSIALGAKLQVRVEGSKKERVQALSNIHSSNERIFSTIPSEHHANEFIVHTHEAGEATASVLATLQGESLSREDRVTFQIARTHTMALEHKCTDERNGAYIQGFPIELNFSRFDQNKQRLLGQGACGVTVEGRDEISEVLRCDEAELELRPIQTPGAVQVKGIQGSSPNDFNSVGVHIISFDKLDFPTLEEHITVHSSKRIRLEPQTDLWPICSPMSFDIHILTPHICEHGAAGSTDVFEVEAQDDYSFMLRAHDFGDCVFQVDLSRYGVSDRWEFSIPVYERD